MPFQKNDFIEVQFTGKLREGGVFDSNIKEDLEKLHHGHDHPIETKPFVFALGQGMFFKGVEDFLIGKDIGEYEISLAPENAFGPRDTKLVQVIPSRIFIQQNLNPVPGAVFNFDNRVGKVITSSGGRVIVDFNNPLSGKHVIYSVKVLRKVTDLDEKIKAFNDFLFRKEIKYNIDGKKITLEVEPELEKFIVLFKDKYKEILGLDLEVKILTTKQAEEIKIEETPQ
ncbi:MAG: peptidylprolyl isomerase [Nanoarchaeota archaeon]